MHTQARPEEHDQPRGQRPRCPGPVLGLMERKVLDLPHLPRFDWLIVRFGGRQWLLAYLGVFKP